MGIIEIVTLLAAASGGAESCEISPAYVDGREENKRQRESRFKLVRQTDGVVDVIYEGDPLDQAVRAFAPFVAIEAIILCPRELVAIARIEQGPGRTHKSDRRVLRVDDALAADVSVVAIIDAGVLLASARALFFAPLVAREPPAFRLVWRSSFSLPSPRSAAPPRPAPSKRR